MNNMPPFQNDKNIVPADQVKFLELRAEPQADPQKIRIYAKKPASKETPTIDLAILDNQNQVIAEASLISLFQEDFVLTMHISESDLKNQPFVLHGKIIFEDPIGVTDHKKTSFTLQNGL